MEQQNNSYGRDLNVTNIDHADKVVIENSFPELPPLDSSYRCIHYLLTLFSLSGNLVTWILLGLFAKSEFPIDYVWKLLVACLRGPKYFSKVLNKEQRKLYNLQENILRAREKFKQETLRLHALNKQESRIEVLEKSIKQLYKEIEDKDKSISRIINGLEYQKNLIQIDLEPLKQRLDPNLYKLEKLLQVLFEGKSSIEKDFERIESILNYLSERYRFRSQNPTTHTVENFLQELNENIVKNADLMGHSRLAALKKVLYISQWVFSVRENSYSPNSALLNSDSLKEESHDSPLDNSIADINLTPTDSTSSTFSNLIEERLGMNLEEFLKPTDVDATDVDATDVDIESIISQYNRIKLDQPTLARKAWIRLLNAQIELLLTQTTETSSDWIDRINEGVRREWIKKISVYGLDAQKRAKIELAISIDWKNQETSRLGLDENQPISLKERMAEFKEFVSANKLTSEWIVKPTNAETSSLLDQIGFSSCDSPKWATEGAFSKRPISEILRFLGAEMFPRLSVELNFGSPSFRFPTSSANSLNSFGVWLLAILVVLHISLSFSPIGQKLDSVQQQEQTYWNTLHKAIVSWDLQTAQRSLIPLSESQNSCTAEFATTLKAALDRKGARGFQDVNPIKRDLNKQYNCSFYVTPYKFSP